MSSVFMPSEEERKIYAEERKRIANAGRCPDCPHSLLQHVDRNCMSCDCGGPLPA